MNIAQKSTFVLGRRHLLGIEGLSAAEIVPLLDPLEEIVELNRQFEKKRLAAPADPDEPLLRLASTLVPAGGPP